MKALWSCYKAFTPEECKWIVETVKKETPTWARTGDTPTLEQTFEHRRSKVFWIYPNHSKLGFLHKKFWEVVTMMNNAYYQVHLTELPPLQFTQYSEQYQGEYKLHMDLDWLNRPNLSSASQQQRKISAVVQLSDPNDYVGGDFQFGNEVIEKPNPKILRQQGLMLSFPSFLHHGVTPVTKGKRYSLVGGSKDLPGVDISYCFYNIISYCLFS